MREKTHIEVNIHLKRETSKRKYPNVRFSFFVVSFSHTHTQKKSKNVKENDEKKKLCLPKLGFDPTSASTTKG